MAASYPSAAKSFTALNNGDVIQDTDVEAAYDEIAALEQALLSTGLAHALFPDASAGARTLGTSSKFWGLSYLKGLDLAAATTLTIAAGIVTAAQSYHAVDTEAAAATDDLDTITAGAGLVEGFVLIVRAANVAHVVTLKDGSGNLLLNGDCALSATDRTLTLIYDGTNWREVARSVAAPVDKCVAFHSTTQSLSDSTETTLSLDSEDKDTSAMHDLVTNNSRVTAKTAGFHKATGIVQFAANTTGYRYATIRKNGTTELARTSMNNAGGVSPTQFPVTWEGDLAVNDYVELRAFQTSGGALNVGSATRALASSLSLRLLP